MKAGDQYIIDLIKKSASLEKGRKKELIQNLKWLSDSQKNGLAKLLSSEKIRYKKIQEIYSQGMRKIQEKFLEKKNGFEKHDIPSLIEKRRQVEKEDDEESAEKLLEELN